MHSPSTPPAPSVHVDAQRLVNAGKFTSLESSIKAVKQERSLPRRVERVVQKFFMPERALVREKAEAESRLESASLALKTAQQLAVKLLNQRDSLTAKATEAARAAGIARSKLEGIRVRIAKANDAVARRVAKLDYINPHAVVEEATTAAAYEHVGRIAAAQSAAADKASAEADAELAAFLEKHADDLAVVEISPS